MQVKILHEAGMELSVGGMAFSFQQECDLDDVKPGGTYKGATILATKDGGHNKFLESIVVWMDIRATMTWWKQADTYRVGMTKLSKSTMHTLMRREIRQEDFGWRIPESLLRMMNSMVRVKEFEHVIGILPMSYLQTRRVCTNYKTIRNMIHQRRGHKLPEWAEFIKSMENLEDYPLLGV